jgi:asparagine synthase (glutamine-hydrolysing)
MCGIAGFTFCDAARDNRAIANSMLAAIAHRGPDEQDVLVMDRVALAHNRLTIMEPEGGQQPRINAASGNVLIYNGEIYGHREFEFELQAVGCELRDHCDTEILFWLLETYGIEQTLAIVDGMFAFAWYEASSDTLHLARDRFGQKPLFFAEHGGNLVFASEIKALRHYPGLQNVTPDLDALSQFLLMEYLPGPTTGFCEISELPAGHMLTYCGGRVEIKSYWQVSVIERDSSIDRESATQILDEVLNSAVQQQLLADVPLGVFLSGGLDSSLIAAIARKHSDDVATFTVKFPYASFDESAHAEAVAASVGTRHTTIELNKQNCVDGIEHLLTQVDQPFCDSSQLPSYLLCKATRQHVTVALGGDGADELFFGYSNFKLLKFACFMAALPQVSASLLRTIAKLMPDSTEYMSNGFLLRQLSYGIGKPAHQQSMYWMSAASPMRQAKLWRDGRVVTARLEAIEALSLLEQCQRQFIESYLAGDILQKMDRASMYSSLEVRSPFLSAAVSEFALSLPVELSFEAGQGKRILRDVAQRYLPAQTISRKKHGFALPVAALLRSDLRDLAEPILLDTSNSMYEHLDFATVNSLWAEHTSKKRNHGKSLWALLMMAVFFRNIH